MNTRVFKITAKTNLHVGNESGGDFTIIDKAIQRDPLTGLPCINSSSLKGAINETLTAIIGIIYVIVLIRASARMTRRKAKPSSLTPSCFSCLGKMTAHFSTTLLPTR